MLFGVRIYGTDPDGLVAMARRAEELGYDSVWRGEHWVIPRQFDGAYPYTKDGRPPFAIDTPILDNFSLMAFLAAHTKTIKFSPGICLLPLHNIYMLARAVTTIDRMSKGRFMLGVGVGWMKEEFDILGADFHNRGRITSEMILALKALWTEREPHFHGKFISVGNTFFEPKPVAKPHPPIFVGGESEAALNRAATLGDGWYGHASEVDHFKKQIAFMRSARMEAGRAHDPFQITVRIKPGATLDQARELEDLGVTRIVLEAGRLDMQDARASLADFEQFADQVVHQYKR